MTDRTNQCDPGRLRLLLDDRLDPGEQAEVAAHLEACAACRHGLEQAAAESRWWGDVRLLAGEPPPTTGPELPGHADPGLGFLDPSTEPGQLGKLGPWDVTEVIGRGGMGVVLKAFDRQLNRFVAIKALAPELATSATARRRFAREAQAAAAITHDHIVAIHAVDAAPNGLPFIVMHYVSGRSLQDRLDKSGPLTTREVLRIGMQAAAGLAAAHAVGLVHRDVKPANILLENCVERVKLTDFGLARAADDASLTQSGVVAGTPQYMAPEQARGEPIDHRADLFSLGSVLYAVCTGRPPFRAETTMGVLRRVCDDTPRPIREINPEVPDWLEAIVGRLQSKDPAGRFQTAAEVSALFGRCLAYLEKPGGPPPYEPLRPPAPARKRAPALSVAAAAALLALAGLGASEASGVTRLADYVATVLRVTNRDGTLVVEVNDPEVKVRVDGDDVVFEGAGPQEIRLSPGKHKVEKVKGHLVEEEVITITRGGKQTVKATFHSVGTGPPVQSNAAAATAPAADPTRLQDRIRELEDQLERQLQARSPDDSLPGRLSRARKRLQEAQRLAPDANDPAVVHLQQVVKQLEEEMAQERLRLGLPINPIPRADGAVVAPGAENFTTVVVTRSAPVYTGPAAGLSEGLFGITTPLGPLPGTVNWPVPAPQVPPPRPFATSRSLVPPPSAVLAVAVSPDARMAALGCADGTVRVIDLTMRRDENVLTGHRHSVRSVAFSPDGKTLASVGGDEQHPEGTGEVVLWDATEGKVRKLLKGHSAMVWSVAFSPDGRTLATGSSDKTARLWDVAAGSTRVVLSGHTDAVRHVAFAPGGGGADVAGGGGTIATAGLDGDLRFWHSLPGSPDDGKLWHTEPIAPRGLSCVVFAPDGKTLAVSQRPSAESQRSDEVMLLDWREWKTRARLKGHVHGVMALAFSPDGKTLASGGGMFRNRDAGPKGGEVILWDVESARIKCREMSLRHPVESLAFSPDGRTLVSGGGNAVEPGEVRLWDAFAAPGMAPRARIEAFKGRRIWSVALARDGSRLAVGLGVPSPDDTRFGVDEGIVGLYDLRTREAKETPAVAKFVRTVAFSPDGATVVSAELDGTTRLRASDDGRELRSVEGPGVGVNGAVFTPDGRSLATAGLDGTVRLYDAASGRLLRELRGHVGRVYGVAVSPDGTCVASCGDDDSVRLWEFATGETRAVLRGHASAVEAVAFSPDGKTLASASWDRTVKLWEVADGRDLATLHGHGLPVLGLAFSPDGKTLATGAGTWGSDEVAQVAGELKLWDVASRSERANLLGHNDRVFGVTFSTDGKTLATAAWDGTVLLWDLDTPRPEPSGDRRR